MAGKKRCSECIFRANHPDHTCDYALFTGETRTKRDMPLAGKQDCDYFVKGDRLTGPREPILVPEMQRKKIMWERAAGMYRSGMNDPQIARVLGCTANAVRAWRRRNGLPMNKAKHTNKEEEKMKKEQNKPNEKKKHVDGSEETGTQMAETEKSVEKGAQVGIPIPIEELADMLADLAKTYSGTGVHIEGRGAVRRVRLVAEVGANDEVVSAHIDLIGGDE